jgi:hypothetical protein
MPKKVSWRSGLKNFLEQLVVGVITLETKPFLGVEGVNAKSPYP